jgi:DNA repair exonuclease SbcCD nuclease subunit
MILFTADWHINLRHKNVPLDWALNRYELFFEQVSKLEEQVDLHIIGGDLFDKVPTMEELDVYFDFVAGVNVRTLIYAGNHEATKKGHTFFKYLANATNRMNPLVEVILDIYETDDYIIVPYEFIHKKEIWANLNKSKVVFSHVRGEIPPHVKPEIDLDLLADFPVVYLGDLHSHSNCQRNMVYPGSPMVTSFHRNAVSTGYILIDSNDLTSWSWHSFDLPQLIRKTVTDPAEMVPTDCDHTIYELEGDVVDLGNIKDSQLLDKKIVKRSTDAALILNKDMSIADELHEYLQFILELPKDKIERVMTTYHDYAITDTGME